MGWIQLHQADAQPEHNFFAPSQTEQIRGGKVLHTHALLLPFHMVRTTSFKIPQSVKYTKSGGFTQALVSSGSCEPSPRLMVVKCCPWLNTHFAFGVVRCVQCDLVRLLSSQYHGTSRWVTDMI